MTEASAGMLSGSTVLVTGAAGFIGSHVCERLHAQGAQLIALDDLSNGDLGNLAAIPAGRIEFVAGDAADVPLVRTLLGRADAVVHLAALVSVQQSFSRPEEGFRRNAAAGFAVLSSAAQQSVPVAYASSAAVYGASDQLPLRELTPTDPLSPYAADKLYLENTASAWRAHGLRSIGLRLFNVYGPRQRADSPYSGVIAKFAERLLAGQPCVIFGDGEQSRDYVHVEDVAGCFTRGILKLLAADPAAAAAQVFNCGTGQSLSVNQLHGRMAALLGADGCADRAAAAAGEVRHSLAEIASVCAALDWAPAVPLERGLRTLLGGPAGPP